MFDIDTAREASEYRSLVSLQIGRLANLSVNISLFLAKYARRWIGVLPDWNVGDCWRFFAAAEMDYHDILVYLSLDGKLTPKTTSCVDDGVIYSFDYHPCSVVTPCMGWDIARSAPIHWRIKPDARMVGRARLRITINYYATSRFMSEFESKPD